eukprot:362191-Chlamydomonas_euryale.AAC.3
MSSWPTGQATGMYIDLAALPPAVWRMPCVKFCSRKPLCCCRRTQSPGCTLPVASLLRSRLLKAAFLPVTLPAATLVQHNDGSSTTE